MKQNAEVQCTLENSTTSTPEEVVSAPECSTASSPTLEQQFKETLQVNARISEELAVARKEILALKAKVKENEVCME